MTGDRYSTNRNGELRPRRARRHVGPHSGVWDWHCVAETSTMTKALPKKPRVGVAALGRMTEIGSKNISRRRLTGLGPLNLQALPDAELSSSFARHGVWLTPSFQVPLSRLPIEGIPCDLGEVIMVGEEYDLASLGQLAQKLEAGLRT